MSTPSDRPSLRLTSAAPTDEDPLPAPLRRALWQQRCSIFGAGARADHIRGTDHQHAQQVALAEELQRLANEAFHLADALERAVGQ